MAKRSAFFIVPALFIAFLVYGFAKTAQPKDLINKPGPTFSLDQVSAGRKLSNNDLIGHPVVLNFWSSWCTPCREEASVLQAKYSKFKSRGVEFVGVNVEDLDKDAERFVSDFGITYPSVRDVNLSLWRELGVRGIPETFFLSDKWVFVSVESGSQIGSRGTTKILGAIEPSVLESQILSMISAAKGKGLAP